MLLAGRSGVGRRSAVSVASSLHRARLVSLRMGNKYGEKQFRAELKAAMQTAGVDGEQVRGTQRPEKETLFYFIQEQKFIGK